MLNVGLIGTGIIGREHAECLAMLPGALRLVSVADELAERAVILAKAFPGVTAAASSSQLINDRGIDLVAIATPPSTHLALVKAALEAGKLVVCEKPIAHTMADAHAITELETRFPGKLTVSHQLRSAPEIRRMLWLVRNGWLGEIKSVELERHGFLPGSSATSSQWWGQWSVAGGGVLITQLIHELDIILEAMGKPKSVLARMDTRYTSIESEDWIEGEIDFGEGRAARFAASVGSGQSRGGLRFKGTNGEAASGRLNLFDPSLQRRAEAAADEALPDTRPPSSSLSARVVRRAGRQIGLASPPTLRPHALLYREIAEAASTGKALPIPARSAIGAVELCAASYASALRGERVVMPLAAADPIWSGITPQKYAARPALDHPRVHVAEALPRSGALRLGLIGLDTTHATTFAELLHNPYAADHIPGARIVAAFPGGSLDMPISASRVGGFTEQLKTKYQVPILDTPEAVTDACDVVLILSADGRTHPGLFRSIAGRGKPVFIDKPFAVSSADAARIVELARETGTSILATSAFRYADPLVATLAGIRARGEKIQSCEIRYWGQIEPTQGRYFWYGIHAAEMLATIMGTGARSVTARTEDKRDAIQVSYVDGRSAKLIGHHNDGTFHCSITTAAKTYEAPATGPVSARLLAAILDRLTPGNYPRLWKASPAGSIEGRPGRIVDPTLAETLEVVRLLEAAQQSLSTNQSIALTS